MSEFGGAALQHGGSVYTDSHAHLEMVAARLGQNTLTEVLTRYTEAVDSAELERPAHILDIGVDGGDLARRKTTVLEAAHAGRLPVSKVPIKWAAGIWPSREALSEPCEALEAFERDLASGVDAVGECGLDYFHMDGSPSEQASLFAAQAERASDLGIPLIVHSREAFADTLRIVTPIAEQIPVVIHCFGYGLSEAEAFIRIGCYISFAGNITYRKSDSIRSALRLIPHDRLLLETDSPYMNPIPHRGSPSCPLDIERTYAYVASLLTMDTLVLRDLIANNLNSVLGIASS